MKNYSFLYLLAFVSILVLLIFVGLAIEMKKPGLASSPEAPEWVIHIRRDTRYGVPYVSTYNAGISSIVWGNASSGAMLTLTLNRGGSTISTRHLTVDPNGNFAISMDRLIEDNDEIQITDGVSSKTVQ
jgi:hypothetical protein